MKAAKFGVFDLEGVINVYDKVQGQHRQGINLIKYVIIKNILISKTIINYTEY